MDNLFKRFFAEVSGTLIISSSVSVGQILNGIDSCAFQTVEALTDISNSSIVISRTFSLIVSSRSTIISVFFRLIIGKLDKQVQMLAENLRCKRNRFFGVDGAVGHKVERELVVVGDVADARILDLIVDVVDRRIDRIGVNQTDYVSVPSCLFLSEETYPLP